MSPRTRPRRGLSHPGIAVDMSVATSHLAADARSLCEALTDLGLVEAEEAWRYLGMGDVAADTSGFFLFLLHACDEGSRRSQAVPVAANTGGIAGALALLWL